MCSFTSSGMYGHILDLGGSLPLRFVKFSLLLNILNCVASARWKSCVRKSVAAVHETMLESSERSPTRRGQVKVEDGVLADG